jgi:hypothetical protein
MKQVSQWRTALLVVLGFVVLLVGFRWATNSPAGLGLFEILRDGVFLLVVTGASKSAVEHLAAGGGVKGAARVLLTEAKPGEPPPTGGGTP